MIKNFDQRSVNMDGTRLVPLPEEELKALSDRHKYQPSNQSDPAELNDTEADSAHSQESLNHSEHAHLGADNDGDDHLNQFADLHGPLYSSQDSRVFEIEGMIRTQFVCYICLLYFQLVHTIGKQSTKQFFPLIVVLNDNLQSRHFIEIFGGEGNRQWEGPK